jgi:hypothetical protein
MSENIRAGVTLYPVCRQNQVHLVRDIVHYHRHQETDIFHGNTPVYRDTLQLYHLPLHCNRPHPVTV